VDALGCHPPLFAHTGVIVARTKSSSERGAATVTGRTDIPPGITAAIRPADAFAEFGVADAVAVPRTSSRWGRPKGPGETGQVRAWTIRDARDTIS